VVTNNIFAYNRKYGFRDDSGFTGPNNKYNNNLTFNNGYGNYVATGGTVNGNIGSSPNLLTIPERSGRLPLRSASPAIDSRYTPQRSQTDLKRRPPTFGRRYDIGCYDMQHPGTWPGTDVEGLGLACTIQFPVFSSRSVRLQ